MDHEATRVPKRPAPRRGVTRARVAAYARTRQALAVAAVALTAVLALVLWLILRSGGTSEPAGERGAAASLRRLYAFAATVGHPVYWAGLQPGYTYELSHTKDGRVYIRYLPPGVEAGSSGARFLTVGTYPQRHAFATLRAIARKQRAQTIHLAGGGIALQYRTRPTSFYVAYPRSDFQIEVFDPSPARARRLVVAGRITPVGMPPRAGSGPTAASVAQLRALAATLGHPLYWAGEHSGTTYEVTRTAQGKVYVRYLPRGVAVGDKRPAYLTIGTYPQKDSLEILKATAAKNHVPTIRLAGGGLALVDPKHPTSVYAAYPKVDVQVEVYDPSPGRARELVTSGQLAPVP